MLPQQAYAAELKRRLFNPPNGRASDEIEVISEAEQRRRTRVELIRQAQETEIKRKLAAEAANRRREELIDAFCEAHRRNRFAWRPILDGGVPVITFEQILWEVCSYFQVPRLHVMARSHGRRESTPRHIVMYLARECTSLCFAQIGRRLDGRDHTTILHGHAKIRDGLNSGDPTLCGAIDELKRRLGISEDRSAA